MCNGINSRLNDYACREVDKCFLDSISRGTTLAATATGVGAVAKASCFSTLESTTLAVSDDKRAGKGLALVRAIMAGEDM